MVSTHFAHLISPERFGYVLAILPVYTALPMAVNILFSHRFTKWFFNDDANKAYRSAPPPRVTLTGISPDDLAIDLNQS